MKFRSIITSQTATNAFLFTASSYAVIPLVLAKEDQEPRFVRPSELSIYPEESKKKIHKENNWEPTIALSSIQKVRKEIVNLNRQWFEVNDRVYTFVQTGISHTESFVDNLRQEKNSTLRAGFVAGSSLAGLLVAARKGTFKKLLYTTAGGSVAFYIGYPNESEEATKIIKRYSIVSYHLINNVTKDLTGFELPSLPAPKGETETDNSEGSKPDLEELLFSLIEYMKGPLQSLKRIVLNEKTPADKNK